MRKLFAALLLGISRGGNARGGQAFDALRDVGTILRGDENMEKQVLRDLTKEERAYRVANVVLEKSTEDSDAAILARQLLREREKYTGRPMPLAPKDGTHILAYLYSEPDDCGYKGFGEWREIFYKPYTSMGMYLPWHAGDPADSHSGDGAPEHFGENVPIAWIGLPINPWVPR